MMTKQTILLTGGTGFLGSNLLRELLSSGYEVLLLARKTSKFTRIEDLVPQASLLYIEETDFDVLFRERKIDAVVHCATNYGRKAESPALILEANLMLPLRLLQAGSENGLSCFINTDTILDKGVSFYSLSKSQFKDWLKVYSDRMTCVNAALEHFYGPWDDSSKFVTWIIQSMLSGPAEIALTAGAQKRDFIYICDVVSVIMAILAHTAGKGSGYLSYEIGSGESLPIRDFVLKIRELSGNTSTRLAFGALPYRQNEVMEHRTDIAGIKALGCGPRVTLEEGLRRTIAFERKRMGL